MPREPGAAGPRGRTGERRRQAMLDAAYTLFVTKGFQSVTIDDILAISGGSKASVYKFFGNKKGVLTAVTEALAERMLQEIAMPATEGISLRESLRRRGMALAPLILGETAIGQQRLAAANLAVDPELSRLWWQRGPATTFTGFAAFLRKEARAGRLKLRSPARAAQYFLGMIGFKENLRMLAGGAPPTEKELRAIVDGAVEVFLAAYAT